jgi:large subunit ribosomal protein L29
MAVLRIKDINAMSSEDRAKKLSELRAELSRIRTMISAGGAVENPSRARELRKAIAQILTVENEKKLGIRQDDSSKKAGTKVSKTPKEKA